MKQLIASATVLAALATAPAARAAPIDALSYLQVRHGFAIAGGAVPAGIVSSVSGPTIDRSNHSLIGDAAATLAADSLTATVGCATCDPPYPYEETGQHRTNRPDPTEFADARHDIDSLIVQDTGAAFFAIGERQITASGLAQARLTSTPAAAAARSSFTNARVNSFSNQGSQTVAFNILGHFDVDLLARYSGADGFSRTSTVIELLFSGIAADALTYLPLDTYFLTTDDTAPGASVTEALVANQPGTLGLRFSASTTALGDGGFTEATLDAEHAFLLRLSLAPGETALMTTAYTQANAVEYLPAPVPLPGGIGLLGGALGFLSLLRARRGPHAPGFSH